MTGRHWLISGRVQGVGFRYYAMRRARALGLVGRVRNLADGRVEVEVAGEAEALVQFRNEVHRGPRGAQVTTIDEQIMAEPPTWDGFEIDR